jgi:hypothetical protein
MVKRNRQEWVSKSFSDYLSSMQAKLQLDTGKKFSRQDITSFLAMQQPVIKIEVRKRRKDTIFDF